MSTPATDQTQHILIIGGGITGLSAGWYLEKFAREAGIDLRYTILEASDRWGGKILTEQAESEDGDRFLIEAGPDSFLTQKPWALALMRELGLEERILDTNDHLRRVFVLKKGKLVPLPDGVFLIIPTKIMPFALSPLISWGGKLRMGMDVFIPARRDSEDETIKDFVSRRLGNEAVDRLAEPLMSGIYNAEADKQSLLATFPRFRDLEAKHGSLIRGMLASRKARAPQAPPGANGHKKRATFVSLIGGTTELVENLVPRLGGQLYKNTGAKSIIRKAEGGYQVTLSTDETIEADQVIVTVPAPVSASLLEGLAPSATELLRTIRYVSTGTVSIAFRANEVDHPLDGFGVVIPQSENRRINAVTWTSTKFDHRAPDDAILLRVFFGGSRRPEMMDTSDADLLAIVREELQELMGIQAQPILHRIFRWGQGNPQYDVGHLDRMDQIEDALPDCLYLAGSAYRGIGVPDCVRQGKETAQALIDGLSLIAETTDAGVTTQKGKCEGT